MCVRVFCASLCACLCTCLCACVCVCVWGALMCVYMCNCYREPAVLFRVCACACKCGREEGRKNSSEQTCQDLLARAQDSEQTNKIVVTRKLHIN